MRSISGNSRILIFLLALLGVVAGRSAVAQGQLIGTYNINYRYNAAGYAPSGGPNDGNPYYNLDPIGPGPYFINADPGQYKVVVTGYGSAGPSAARIWNGDASSGSYIFTPSPGNIGDSIVFTHTYGQIVFYYWDWYDYDNPDTISVTVELYRINTQPDIEITTNAPSDGIYRITSEPSMPEIKASAKVVGITPDPTLSTTFTWTVYIDYNATTDPHGPYRDEDGHVTNPRLITFQTEGTSVGMNLFIPDFGTTIRGGELTLEVSATINGTVYTKRTQDLSIYSDPIPKSLIQQAPNMNDVLRRIATYESGQTQFLADGHPYWTEDNAGGAGIFQITNPQPTDDQVWNWQLNVQEGIAIFNDKISDGLNYPNMVRNSSVFRRMIQEYNFRRARMGLPPVTITLPAFTTNGGNYNNVRNDDTSNQLELNTIRAFNGVAGSDIFGFRLREFKVGVIFDVPSGKNVLKVLVNEQTRTGQCVWERVTPGERSAQFPNGYPGDANYVTHVLNSNPTP